MRLCRKRTMSEVMIFRRISYKCRINCLQQICRRYLGHQHTKGISSLFVQLTKKTFDCYLTIDCIRHNPSCIEMLRKLDSLHLIPNMHTQSVLILTVPLHLLGSLLYNCIPDACPIHFQISDWKLVEDTTCMRLDSLQCLVACV